MAKLLPSTVNSLTFGTGAALGVRFGCNAGSSNFSSDVVIGSQAGLQNTCGTNVAVGYKTGNNASNSNCTTLIGAQAGASIGNTGGLTAVGVFAGYFGSTNSTALGVSAMGNVNRVVSTAMGTNAGQCMGQYSLALGRRAGRYRASNFAISIGNQSAELNTAGGGTTQINIGFYTGRFLGGGASQLHVGWYAYQHFGYGVSGQSTLGRGHNSTGCVWVGWTNVSDCRDKTNIQSLPSELGLNLIRKLRPVKFNWDQRRDYVDKCGFEYGVKDGTLISEEEDYGFLAQELEFAAKQTNNKLDLIHYDEFNDAYSVTYLDMIASLTKALQEINQDLDLIENHLNS
jgi:hypothetical protein